MKASGTSIALVARSAETRDVTTRFWLRLLPLLMCAIGSLSCARSSARGVERPGEASTPEKQVLRDDRRALWAKAEAVWREYARQLDAGNGEAAAKLVDESAFRGFGHFKVAALAIDREHLLRFSPEDVVTILHLRASTTATELEAMTEREVFVILVNTGLLKSLMEPNVQISRQEENRLLLDPKDPYSNRLVVTEEGPRVSRIDYVAALRKRLGIEDKDLLAFSAEDILGATGRSLRRPPDPSWLAPLRPVPEEALRKTLAKLAKKAESPSDSANVQSASSEGPTSNSAAAKKAVYARLDPNLIRKEVRSHFGSMRVCYENGLARNPNLEGRVDVRFVIETDGRVIAERHEFSPLFEDVADCVAAQFLTMEFPKPEGGVLKVTYPIAFSPG